MDVLIRVQSSNIAAVGYRLATETLIVEFRGGSSYSYSPVPVEVYDGLMIAESKGSYLARHVTRNKAYTATKLADVPVWDVRL